MLLLYGCGERPKEGQPGFAEALAGVNAFVEECRRRGVFVGGEPLRPERTATTVQVRDGQTLITDGPYAETHEQLGGYFVIECDGPDEALELAALWPLAAVGGVEVRQVDDVPGMSWSGEASDLRIARS
jgi:hypothetical protein